MLEKPALEDEKIIGCLRDEFGLKIVRIAFLPLGADLHTAVYRASSEDSTTYFVKLRSGMFDETSVLLPRFLSQQGITQIISPLETKTGSLWAGLQDYKVLLYPFIEGQDGVHVPLSDPQWIELGRALKRIHTTNVPEVLARRIRRETFSPKWRDSLKGFMRRLDGSEPADPVAVELIDFLKEHREQTGDLMARSERLALGLTSGTGLKAQPLEFVLCHYDIHGWNVLIAPSGAFFIVDWDDPIFAPKERDLMFFGSGFYGNWRSPEEEESLFYRGYGPTQIDPAALAYYRYERIVEDMAVECQSIFGGKESLEDREQSLRYLKSNFLPGNSIEVAYRSDGAV